MIVFMVIGMLWHLLHLAMKCSFSDTDFFFFENSSWILAGKIFNSKFYLRTPCTDDTLFWHRQKWTVILWASRYSFFCLLRSLFLSFFLIRLQLHLHWQRIFIHTFLIDDFISLHNSFLIWFFLFFFNLILFNMYLIWFCAERDLVPCKQKCVYAHSSWKSCCFLRFLFVLFDSIWFCFPALFCKHKCECEWKCDLVKL